MNNKIAVVILAGGGGKRLGGVIKANLKINGTSLFDLVAANVKNIDGPHILSIGDMDASRFCAGPEWILLNDLDNNPVGPLAGLAAAVAYLRQREEKVEFLLSVAVDSPFFPDFFSSKALENINKNLDVVVASYGGQIYPTNALWRFDSITGLPEQFEKTAKFGIKGLLRQLRVSEMALDEYDPKNPCQNLNSVSDILAIGKRVKSKGEQIA